MSKENLPEKINPYRFAEAKTALQGSLRIKDMQRLLMSVASDEGEVSVSFQFGVDEQGTRFVRGHLETQLILQCQRCMETFVYEIMNDFLSGLVRTEEEAKRLPETYEPVLTEDDMLVIQDMIEDELIINLPIVPMHNLKDCKVQLPKMVLGSDKESDRDDANPFKVIEILRVKRDNNRNQE